MCVCVCVYGCVIGAQPSQFSHVCHPPSLLPSRKSHVVSLPRLSRTPFAQLSFLTDGFLKAVSKKERDVLIKELGTIVNAPRLQMQANSYQYRGTGASGRVVSSSPLDHTTRKSAAASRAGVPRSPSDAASDGAPGDARMAAPSVSSMPPPQFNSQHLRASVSVADAPPSFNADHLLDGALPPPTEPTLDTVDEAMDDYVDAVSYTHLTLPTNREV